MGKLSDLVLKGIKNKRRAFIGPRIVQIDLTGRCDNSCVGCWVHSPYIKNASRDKNITLPFEKVRKLVDELSRLGTEEIYLSGAGEPFLHPNIMEVIECIKKHKMRLNIVTNFTFIDQEVFERLIALEVDLLTVSLWAGEAETYRKTHPNKEEEHFDKIKDRLKRFLALREQRDITLPKIKIYNVICSLNYDKVLSMIDFALEKRADFVEFQMLDMIEKETDALGLSREQTVRVAELFERLKKHKDLHLSKELELFNPESELKEFPGRFFRVPPGFELKEWIEENNRGAKAALHLLKCPQGFSTIPSGSNPLIDEVKNRLIFTFCKDTCKSCSLSECACPVDRDGKISLKYTQILGFGTFARRLNSALKQQAYDKQLIEDLPCYIGWIYSRILSTGEVVPCCKAVNKPLGNLHKADFSVIWNSGEYRGFRNKAKLLPKNKPYFREINCSKSCDNVGINLQMKHLLSEGKKKQDLRPEVVSKREREVSKDLPQAEAIIVLPATNMKSGNLNSQHHDFGQGIVIDGGHGSGYAEYEVELQEPGKYEIWSRYASGDRRPVELYFDDNLLKSEALDSITNGWTTEFLYWLKELELSISAGRHRLRISARGFIPHIHSIAFLKKAKEPGNSSNMLLSEKIYYKPSVASLFKDKMKSIGFLSSSFKALNYIISGRLVSNYLDILGIYNGAYAFKGPFHIQIDLTHDCNNNCLGCWCNSPLLGEKMLGAETKRQALPFDLIKELFDELRHMNVKEIYFSGSGEPFMHPRIMEILEYAKRSNFTCYVNTNFTLLDKDMIRRIIDLKVEHLTVSSWAATPGVYALTHPNKNEDTFRRLEENLRFLNKTKKGFPHIKLYNVIFNSNYHELKEMVTFARETFSESVEFTLIDTIPRRTDKLLLNPEQISKLQNSARELARCLDKDGRLNGVLLFRFDSFLRRISSFSDLTKATYDRNIIDRIPCYIGWCFSRIIPNGDVHACLKAHRIPSGNLYHASFKDIWNGDKQKYFRKKTLVYEKSDSFFRSIGNDPDIKEAGCYKSCDDIGRNIHIHNRIMSLTPLERGILRVLAKTKRRSGFGSRSPVVAADPLKRGIAHGRSAFIGPEQVVIDLTNRCNEKCVGCWLYSPLLKNRPAHHYLRQELDFPVLKRLIDDLTALGTKRIRFTGGGEPFMHPQVMRLLEYVKSKGLICCLTTNFSLLDEGKVKELLRLQIDELAISLWASTNETYQKTHPGISADAFEKIKEKILILKNSESAKPFVTLCNVICNLNYLEVEDMFRFAVEAGVDGVYFTLVDIAEGTDSLLLDKEQKEAVLKQTEIIWKHWQGLPESKKPKLDYWEGFISRVGHDGALRGRYDCARVNQIPCYAGWTFARILADGAVAPCCRGVKKLMGNINNQDFKDIWFNEKYAEFRAKAKYLPKTDPYFDKIDCIKMCDNLMHNEETHRRIESTA